MSIIQGTALSAGGFYPYELNQSLRFNDDDSAYLSWTPASAGNRKTWTWSGWVKRGNLGSYQAFLASGVDGGNRSEFGFTNIDTIIFTDATSNTYYGVKTNAVFRDVGSWYHIVAEVDTTQATASDRVKIYVNGVSQSLTTSGLSGYIPQNTDLDINSTQKHAIGATAYTVADLGDFYLSEVNFIDGTALDADSFGELKDGIWVPKRYGGSYGTNGFYLDFADGGALGDDESGNANDWTSNNLAATDVMLDNPTNNFATLNVLDKDSDVVLSEGNLKFNGGSAAANGGIRGTFELNGKSYFEYLCTSTSATSGIGIATSSASLTTWAQSGHYYYINVSGNKVVNGTETAYGATFADGDIVGIAYDADTGSLEFYKNNSSQGSISTGLTGAAYPFIIDGSGLTVTGIANFGQDSSFAGNKVAQGNVDANGRGDFYYSPPSGYLALCTANLPEPAILDAGQHFNTVLYTGDGTTDRTITGFGFNPDFNWLKARSIADNHVITDVLRGTNHLHTNTTDADSDISYPALATDGFTVSGGTYNNSGVTFVSWGWKADNTSGTTNTDGSITSTVSANPTAGFSIVGYTGTGANATVGHGLGVAPDVIITKNRDTAAIWPVYHSANTSAPETDYLRLNATDATNDASTVWNDTAPTSSVFSVGTALSVNGSGDAMIAYCFHSVEGYSKFGSYTGNGSADGPFVYTGFRPAWVLIKRTDTSGDGWVVIDSARSPFNEADDYLYPDTSAAEYGGTGNDGRDYLSNGFKISNTYTGQNASGGTYTYMAFAESPFKYSNAR